MTAVPEIHVIFSLLVNEQHQSILSANKPRQRSAVTIVAVKEAFEHGLVAALAACDEPRVGLGPGVNGMDEKERCRRDRG